MVSDDLKVNVVTVNQDAGANIQLNLLIRFIICLFQPHHSKKAAHTCLAEACQLSRSELTVDVLNIVQCAHQGCAP